MNIPAHANATDWRPTTTLEALQARSALLKKTRNYFDGLGFIEVQTPCLSQETVIDVHLDPLEITIAGQTFFMQTSPEAAMKRLLAAGAPAIYQIGPVFRRDECGRLHNLEFTMLEWYRCGDSMDQGISLLVDLVSHLTGLPPATRIQYRQLFRQHLGFDPIDIALPELKSFVNRSNLGYTVREDDDQDTLLDIVMGLILQPLLKGALVISNYPISQAALARPSETDPTTAERFELFVDGVEIANGYAELVDADAMLDRCQESNRIRLKSGKPQFPIPHKLISAMRHGLPPCSGTALGFDRLVMLATNQSQIEDVLSFPLTIA